MVSNSTERLIVINRQKCVRNSPHYYTTTITSTSFECWHSAGWVYRFIILTPNSEPTICVLQQELTFRSGNIFQSLAVQFWWASIGHFIWIHTIRRVNFIHMLLFAYRFQDWLVWFYHPQSITLGSLMASTLDIVQFNALRLHRRWHYYKISVMHWHLGPISLAVIITNNTLLLFQ